MNMKYIKIFFCTCLIVSLLHSEQIPPSFYSLEDMGTINKEKYLLSSMGVLIVGSIAGLGLLYLMPSSFTNWDKNDIANDFSKVGKKWKRNVSLAPVVDSDDIFLNWVTHPYWGAVYYMQPRIVGYDWTQSAIYSFVISSFFWEYGVEAFAEVPSWQDLIITPAFGAILGELFYRSTRYIENNNMTLLNSKFLGYTAAIFMDPFRVILQNSPVSNWIGIKKATTTSFIIPDNKGAKLIIMLNF